MFGPDKNQQFNWLLGGIVFIISSVAYTLSVAPTTSFWDCGEFIACSYNLGVMHPPGAPLYLLIGRILILLPIFKDIGLRVNIFSVFISAATVLLTYMVLVQLIRRWRGEAGDWYGRLVIYGSSFLGSLAFAFTDSFWFNAVEAEVYAFSMFFTALVVWLAFYWEERSDRPGNMLLIIFIFYIFGLATVVHLLNILVFPFLLLIAYFHSNQTVRRLLLLIFVQIVVPILLYILLYQFDPDEMLYDYRAHQAKAGQFLKIFGSIWIILTLLYIYVKDRRVFTVWWVIPCILILGYSLYAVIYIRAGLDPPINENDPSTLNAMMDYLQRKQYGEHDLLLTFFHRNADFWNYQVNKMYTRYFGWQFIGKGPTMDYYDRIVEVISFKGLYGLPFIVGLWGAIHHFSKDWKRALAVGVLFILTGYAIIIYLNQPDPQPRERDYSYVGSFYAFALWIGTGIAGILESVESAVRKKGVLKNAAFGLAIMLLFIAVPLNLYAFNRESHNRRGNYVPYDYSYNILETCEKDGIVFTNGDNDTFPLWFLQEVYGVRKDVRVVNLSLLNTTWYIKQLRDQEPRIPIDLSDRVIDELSYIEWETQEVGIRLNEKVRQEELERRRALRLSLRIEDIPVYQRFSLSPTYPTENPRVLRVQDLMVLRILEGVNWRKPVYFAVTVSRDNMIGLDRHLRMDGLAYQVRPFPVQREVEPDFLKSNLLNKFEYRNLDNPEVYYDTNTIKLLQNYRSAFLQLIRYYIDNGLKEEASRMLDEMATRIPAQVIPYSHERLALLVAELYRRVGRAPEAEKQIDFVIPGTALSERERLILRSQYAQVMGEWEQAEQIFLEIIEENPNDVEAISELIHVYELSRQYGKAVRILEQWLRLNPGDLSASKMLERYRKMALNDSSAARDAIAVE